MTIYRAGNTILDLDNAADRVQLGRLQDARRRLLCDRGTRPLEMYLARTATGIQVKRMPGTGPLHSPRCISYEPPAELSGAATLFGTAIIESPDTGATILHLGFAMSRRGPQPVPVPGEGQSETAKASQHKLTLRGLLHYLWEEGRLNHWTPQWSGKRNWKVLLSHLSTAASTKMIGTEPLNHALFIPKPFQLDHKDDIVQRRRAHLARLTQQPAASKNL